MQKIRIGCKTIGHLYYDLTWLTNKNTKKVEVGVTTIFSLCLAKLYDADKQS